MKKYLMSFRLVKIIYSNKKKGKQNNRNKNFKNKLTKNNKKMNNKKYKFKICINNYKIYKKTIPKIKKNKK